jgi:hypothetical protein
VRAEHSRLTALWAAPDSLRGQIRARYGG